MTPIVIYCDQDRCKMNLFNPESGLYCVFLTRLDINYSFLYRLSLIMCESDGKIIARALCFVHQGILIPNYIFNNDAYVLDFLRPKIPFDLF